MVTSGEAGALYICLPAELMQSIETLMLPVLAALKDEAQNKGQQEHDEDNQQESGQQKTLSDSAETQVCGERILLIDDDPGFRLTTSEANFIDP